MVGVMSYSVSGMSACAEVAVIKTRMFWSVFLKIVVNITSIE